MKTLMATNTYLPHVGGVAKSVHSFTEVFRAQGHDVLVVCPEFEETRDDEADVVRVPAIQKFNGSDFSVSLPFYNGLENRVFEFQPDVVHSHHPFLLGDTAVRLANILTRPLVFTYHTMYEDYIHYVPSQSEGLRDMAVELAKGYCALCDHVIAPSESIAEILRGRGIQTPMTPIPTGIDVEKFSSGDRNRSRREYGWDEETFVVGHVGRLAREKNLLQLADAIGCFLQGHENAAALIVGTGDVEDALRDIFASRGLEERVVMPGQLTGQALADAYRAMDVFAFASQTETQGMVLAEAMSARVPVVAHDAPGAREIVREKINGRLIHEKTAESLVDAMRWVKSLPRENREDLCRAALETAHEFSLDRCAQKVLEVYRQAGCECRTRGEEDLTQVTRLKERFNAEWEIWKNRIQAVGSAIPGSSEA